MNRLRGVVVMALLSGVIAGCGSDQPNTPAQPEDVASPDFSKKTQDMMKDANSGMDLKAAKGASKKH
jgi:hypothetical protein